MQLRVLSLSGKLMDKLLSPDVAKARLREIGDRMVELSAQIAERTSNLNGDILSIRNDSVIKSLWNRLCLLHMKGIVICEEYEGEEKPVACATIQKPQACVELLHLAEEQTCCGRLLKRKSEIN